MSAGIATLSRVVDPVAFVLLQASCAMGRDPKVTVDELEGWTFPVLEGERILRAVAGWPKPLCEDPLDIPVAWDGRELVRAGTGELAVQVGPNPAGTYTRLSLPAVRPGQRVGDLNAALMRFLDVELGSTYGDVVAPPDVRAR
jgi:hypothetical protein